jgi:hypothetical protein
MKRTKLLFIKGLFFPLLVFLLLSSGVKAQNIPKIIVAFARDTLINNHTYRFDCLIRCEDSLSTSSANNTYYYSANTAADLRYFQVAFKVNMGTLVGTGTGVVAYRFDSLGVSPNRVSNSEFPATMQSNVSNFLTTNNYLRINAVNAGSMILYDSIGNLNYYGNSSPTPTATAYNPGSSFPGWIKACTVYLIDSNTSTHAVSAFPQNFINFAWSTSGLAKKWVWIK